MPTKRQKRHQWPQRRIKQLREKALNAIENILDDPHSNDRAIGIACRNLGIYVAQNILLDDPRLTTTDHIQVTIVRTAPVKPGSATTTITDATAGHNAALPGGAS